MFKMKISPDKSGVRFELFEEKICYNITPSPLNAKQYAGINYDGIGETRKHQVENYLPPISMKLYDSDATARKFVYFCIEIETTGDLQSRTTTFSGTIVPITGLLSQK
jgi:hypothetical protein